MRRYASNRIPTHALMRNVEGAIGTDEDQPKRNANDAAIVRLSVVRRPSPMPSRRKRKGRKWRRPSRFHDPSDFRRLAEISQTFHFGFALSQVAERHLHGRDRCAVLRLSMHPSPLPRRLERLMIGVNAGYRQVFGLAGWRSSSYGRLASRLISMNQCLKHTAFVPDYRCGTVPDSHWYSLLAA